MTSFELLPRITQQEKMFADTYAKTGDKKASVIAGWPSYAKKAKDMIVGKAARTLAVPAVKAYLAEVNQQVTQAVITGAESVFKEWVELYLADPAELSQFRRNNCRHCYGTDGGFQWISRTEWADEYARVMDANRYLPENMRKEGPEPPELQGGVGFNPQRPVNPHCPKCAGEGVEQVWIADTRTMSPAARKLYAGVEMTKNGPKVITRDRDKALENIAKVLGMFQERITLTIPGQDTGMPASLPADPILAAQTYMTIIKGSK